MVDTSVSVTLPNGTKVPLTIDSDGDFTGTYGFDGATVSVGLNPKTNVATFGVGVGVSFGQISASVGPEVKIGYTNGSGVLISSDVTASVSVFGISASATASYGDVFYGFLNTLDGGELSLFTALSTQTTINTSGVDTDNVNATLDAWENDFGTGLGDGADPFGIQEQQVVKARSSATSSAAISSVPPLYEVVQFANSGILEFGAFGATLNVTDVSSMNGGDYSNTILMVANNSSITAGNGDFYLDAVGTGSTISAGAGAVVGLVSSDDTLDASGAEAVTIGGVGDNATASDSTVTFLDDSDAGIYGGGNTINGGTGDEIYLSDTAGDTDTVNASNDQFGTALGDSGNSGVYLTASTQANVLGTGDDVQLASQDNLGIDTGNEVDGGADEEIYVASVNSDATTLNVSGDSLGNSLDSGGTSGIYMTDDAQVNVVGSDDGIQLASDNNVGASGGGNQIYANSSDEVYVADTDGSADGVNVSNDALGTSLTNGGVSGIYMADNAQLNVVGSGNGIDLASGDDVGADGGGYQISGGNDDEVYISNTGGNSDSVTVSDDALGTALSGGGTTGVYLVDDAQANVIGSEDGIQLGSGDDIGASGGYNTIDGGANDEIYVTNTGGDADVVDASNDTLGAALADGATSGIYVTDNSQTQVAGSDDGIELGSGDTLGLLGGSNNSVSGADDTINTDTSASTSFNLSGGSDTVNLGDTGDYLGLLGGSNYAVDGADDTINTTPDSETSFNLSGGDDTVTLGGTGDYLGLLGGANYAVTGADDTIDTTTDAATSFNLSGGDDTVTLGGTGDYLGLLGGANYAVAGADDTIDTTTDAATNFNLSGGDDAVTLGGTGDYLGLLGGSDYTVTGADDTIETAAGVTTGFTLDGNSDDVTFGSSGDSITLDGSETDIINGSNETIDGNDGDTIEVYGSNDIIDASESHILDYGSNDDTDGGNDTVDPEDGGEDDKALGTNDVDSEDEGGGTNGYGGYLPTSPGGGGGYGPYGYGPEVVSAAPRGSSSGTWSIAAITQYDQANAADIGEDGGIGRNGEGVSTLTFSNPAAGISRAVFTYSGQNGTGQLEGELEDLTSGTSILYAKASSGSIAETISIYSALDLGGTLTTQIQDNTDGSSLERIFTPSHSLSEVSFGMSGTNATGSVTSALLDATAGGSIEASLDAPGTNPVSLEVFSGSEATGTLILSLTNNPNGTSTVEQAETGTASTISYEFTGGNGSGQLAQITYSALDGTSEVDTFDVNGSETAATSYSATGEATKLSLTSAHAPPAATAVAGLQAQAASAMQQVIQAISNFSDGHEPPIAYSPATPVANEASQLAAPAA